MAITPTDEQEDAVEAFRKGGPLKIAAFAGTGKTSTLIFMARSRRVRGLYLAFNKAIADEAESTFPTSVKCRTTHSMAFRAIIGDYSRSKLGDSLHTRSLVEAAGYEPRNFDSKFRLTGVQQAHLLLGTIKQFCQGAAAVIGEAHVPGYGRLVGADAATVSEVRSWAVTESTALWRRMTDPGDKLPMGHDGYLKLWALGDPILDAEYILLDEAQDTNEVVLGVLRRQSGQIVYVGDKHQQIYEWRGAVNAMERVTGCLETDLTLSFRFGEIIAAAASRVLATLGESLSFAEDEEGESIRSFVQLIEQHGERKLLPAVESAHGDESTANVVLSTAHKAKGREWDSVRLAADFSGSRPSEQPAASEAEIRLFYVAMTRAKQVLAVDPAVLARFTTKAAAKRALAPTPGKFPAPSSSRLPPPAQAPSGRSVWRRLFGR